MSEFGVRLQEFLDLADALWRGGLGIPLEMPDARAY